MKKVSTLFLKIVIVMIGIAVATFMLWEPHLEGRNVGATFFQIYFNDPFLAYAYTGSIAFFVALNQAYKLLNLIGENKVFSEEAIRILKKIKYCAFILTAFLIGALAYIWIFVRGTDDIAGGVAMGLCMTFISLVIASTADVFQKILHMHFSTK